jgi:hypothetical protein
MAATVEAITLIVAKEIVTLTIIKVTDVRAQEVRAKEARAKEVRATKKTSMCCALLRMRPLSISCAEGFVVISCGKSIMTNLAGETIDARCVDSVYIYIYIHIYA